MTSYDVISRNSLLIHALIDKGVDGDVRPERHLCGPGGK